MLIQNNKEINFSLCKTKDSRAFYYVVVTSPNTLMGPGVSVTESDELSHSFFSRFCHEGKGALVCTHKYFLCDFGSLCCPFLVCNIRKHFLFEFVLPICCAKIKLALNVVTLLKVQVYSSYQQHQLNVNILAVTRVFLLHLISKTGAVRKVLRNNVTYFGKLDEKVPLDIAPSLYT